MMVAAPSPTPLLTLSTRRVAVVKSGSFNIDRGVGVRAELGYLAPLKPDLHNVDVKTKSTSQIVDELGSFEEAGAERAYLQLLDLTDTDQVRLLAAEVKPHL